MFIIPSTKRKGIIMWIHVYLNWKTYFNSKIGNNSSFSYEIKGSISLILTRRTCLWYPITKWNEITICIHVYLNWKTYFNSKIGNKSSFSYEIKGSISLILRRRTCLWCPIMKRNDFTIYIHIYPNWKTYLILKLVTREVFLLKPKHQYH